MPGLPAKYAYDEEPHPCSDATSENPARAAMTELLKDDAVLGAETRDAFCRQLRYEYACFGYVPDRVCARASEEAMSAKCPISRGEDGAYTAAPGYAEWYSDSPYRDERRE